MKEWTRKFAAAGYADTKLEEEEDLLLFYELDDEMHTFFTTTRLAFNCQDKQTQETSSLPILLQTIISKTYLHL